MSNNVFTGFVSKKNSKSGTSKKNGRAWTAWSIRLEDKEGEEIQKWFRFGFEEPQLKEGDYVRFTCKEVKEQFAEVDLDTLRISKNPPARAEKKQSSGGNKSSGGGGYNSPEQRADRAYHAARGSAIEVVDVLLSHDALPVSKAKTKAGEAKRYEEVMAFVDKITVKYFRDEFPEYEGDFRILVGVADEGVSSPQKSGDLPDDADGDDDDNSEFEGGDDSGSESFPEDDEGF